MFTVLVVAHLLYAFAVRRPPEWHGAGGVFTRLRSNRLLLVAVGLGIALQASIVALPAGRAVFGTVPLSLREWALVGIGAALPVAVMVLLLPGRRVTLTSRNRMRG